MYNHIWKKYIPIINIQLKKSAAGEQMVALNRIDFERAGSGRKAGYKFTIELNNGRVGNVISGSPLASALAEVLLENDSSKAILKDNSYTITLNTKFQLFTKNCNPAQEEQKEQSEQNEIPVEESVEETA